MDKAAIYIQVRYTLKFYLYLISEDDILKLLVEFDKIHQKSNKHPKPYMQIKKAIQKLRYTSFMTDNIIHASKNIAKLYKLN